MDEIVPCGYQSVLKVLLCSFIAAHINGKGWLEHITPSVPDVHFSVGSASMFYITSYIDKTTLIIT